MTSFYKINFIPFFLLLAGLVWQTTVFAAPKSVAVTPIPVWVKPVPQRLESNINPKDVNDGYYYLQRSIQWQVQQQAVYYHNTYKITAEDGVQNNSELKFSFDPNYEKLELHKVTVWRNGKPLNKLNLANVKVIQREQGLEQRIYDESLTAVLFLEDIRIGDLIEYACSIKGANPIFGGKFFNSFNLQFYDPVDELLVHIIAPAHRKLNYRLYKSEHKPAIATANGTTTYTWHLKDLPATPVDDDLPGWYDPYPGVYVSEYSTWEEVIKWALPLYDLKEKPSGALQAKIDSIKSAYSQDGERLSAALRFVQDEVRYLGLEAGIGGYKPRAPSAVFAQRFGDCKDKSLLLCTMLREMGMQASPALLHTANKGTVADMLPSPYAFNHCIVQVRLAGQTYWYDPTASMQRGLYNNISVPGYQKALVINSTAKGLAEMYAKTSSDAKVKVQESFHFDSVGAGTVKLLVKTSYAGSEADFQRSYFSTTSLKEIEKGYLNFYASTYPEIETGNSISFYDAEAANTFTVEEEYVIENLWEAQEENGNVLQAAFYPHALNEYTKQPRTKKRFMPLSVRYPVEVEHSIMLFLPEYWPVKAESKKIQDDAFTYTSDISFDEKSNLAVFKYTYAALNDHVVPAKTAAYIKNLKLVQDDMGQSLTYDKSIAAGGAEPDYSAAAALFALLVFCAAAFGAYRLYFYDPAPAPGFGLSDGKAIGGWLLLVAIGLSITPLRMLSVVFDENYFKQSVWDGLFGNSAGISPAVALLVVLELAFNILFLVYSCILVYLFFRRRTSVPRLAIVFYAANLAFLLIDALVADLLELPSDSGAKTVKEVMQSLVAAAIWIPYFNLSHRVKETFVEQLRPTAAPETIGADEAEEAAVLN